MKILVTGGSGFIGRNLIQQLIDERHQITCLIRRPPSPPIGDGNVRFVEGDLHNLTALREAVTDQEVIFHLAGAIAARTPQDFHHTNVLGTENLLQSVQIHNRDCRRVVLLSSITAAGPSELHTRKIVPQIIPKLEDDPRLPISEYGISKKKAEEAAAKFADNVNITIVRPPAVYGPWDRQFLPFFKMAKVGLSTPLWRRQKFYSVIYVDDLVRGMMSLATRRIKSGEIFNLADPRVYTWNDMVEAIVKSMDAITLRLPVSHGLLKAAAYAYEIAAHTMKKPLSYGLDKYNEFAAGAWVCSTAKAEKELEFKTTTNLIHGMELTAKWYRDFHWV